MSGNCLLLLNTLNFCIYLIFNSTSRIENQMYSHVFPIIPQLRFAYWGLLTFSHSVAKSSFSYIPNTCTYIWKNREVLSSNNCLPVF